MCIPLSFSMFAFPAFTSLVIHLQTSATLPKGSIFYCNLIGHSSFTVCTSERGTMELADRTIGLLLTVTSLSIFTYYTFWVIILVSSFSVLQDVVTFETYLIIWGLIYALFFFFFFLQPLVDTDHFVHRYFLPQEYAILIPVFIGMALICLLSMFIGYVMLKSKKNKA